MPKSGVHGGSVEGASEKTLRICRAVTLHRRAAAERWHWLVGRRGNVSAGECRLLTIKLLRLFGHCARPWRLMRGCDRLGHHGNRFTRHSTISRAILGRILRIEDTFGRSTRSGGIRRSLTSLPGPKSISIRIPTLRRAIRECNLGTLRFHDWIVHYAAEGELIYPPLYERLTLDRSSPLSQQSKPPGVPAGFPRSDISIFRSDISPDPSGRTSRPISGNGCSRFSRP